MWKGEGVERTPNVGALTQYLTKQIRLGRRAPIECGNEDTGYFSWRRSSFPMQAANESTNFGDKI